MAWRRRFEVPGGGCVHAAFTDRSDGDFSDRALGGSVGGPVGGRVGAPTGAEARSRCDAVAAHPWTWLTQVHGSGVVVVDTPGARAGEEADAAVSARPGAVLAVRVADCAPVLMFAPAPGGTVVVAAAHAGWRGLLDGVLPATVGAMRALGAGRIEWLVGPCISAGEYEFSAVDVDRLADLLGDAVRGRTASGSPALDLRAGVHSAMHRAGLGAPVAESATCTAGSASHWSHRAAADPARQAGVIWWEGDAT